MPANRTARLRPALPKVFATALLAGMFAGTLADPAQADPAHGADSPLHLATLMTGSEGGIRDAMEEDFVPRKQRVAGCRSFSSDAGAARRFMNARLLTARPHAAVYLGPGKHFCIRGFVVGRGLRLEVISETKGWYRIKLGAVEGWVAATSVRREL